MTEKINEKLRLKAIEIMLSAKLYENRIVMIDTEKIDFHKTKYLNQVIKPYMSDKLTFLTSFDQDQNFLSAASNMGNITVKNPQQFNIPHLIKSDLIFMTKEGLS